MTAWRPIGDRPVRVGLAGLGAMGRNHLRVLRAHPGATVVAVADPSPEAVASAAAAAGAGPPADPAGPAPATFADARAMLAEVDLDALVVATPTTAHLDLTIEALDRAVACLVEKPLAATGQEARQIAEHARRTGVPVQVGHVERFNPAVIELGRRLAEGWLGQVYAVASRRAGPLPERIRDVGVTVDLATHDVDILAWIAGERPVRVQAETARRRHAEHEDLLFGLLGFPSGTVGMLDVDWLTPAKRRQLIVIGEAGMFELDYLTQRLTFTESAGLDRPRLIAGYAPTFEGEQTEIEVATHEPLAAQLDAFLGIVREGGRPVVDADDGLWAVALAGALLEAARTGRSIVPDVAIDGEAAAIDAQAPAEAAAATDPAAPAAEPVEAAAATDPAAPVA